MYGKNQLLIPNLSGSYYDVKQLITDRSATENNDLDCMYVM